MKSIYKSLVTRGTNTDLAGANNVGVDVTKVFTATALAYGQKTVTIAGGGGPVQIFPPELNGKKVQFDVLAIFNANEPIATQRFTLIEDAGGTPQTIKNYWVHSCIGTDNDDVTITNNAANPTDFIITYYQVST